MLRALLAALALGLAGTPQAAATAVQFPQASAELSVAAAGTTGRLLPVARGALAGDGDAAKTAAWIAFAGGGEVVRPAHRIDSGRHAYAKARTDRLEIVKDALRAVTGLIRQRREVSFSAETATIGIRGALRCHDHCGGTDITGGAMPVGVPPQLATRMSLPSSTTAGVGRSGGAKRQM